MPRTRPPINHEVLRWAVDESGYSPEDIASHLGIGAAEVEGWLAGDGGPGRGQFTKIAKKLRRPKAIFYLPEPPSSGTPPRLRRAVGTTQRELGADELLQVRRARRLQRLLGLLARDGGAAAVELPSLTQGSDANAAGARLRTWLGVTLDRQLGWNSPREAFEAWRDATETHGVAVMQLPLGSEGLRGFALTDAHAPLLAVNTRENMQARIFTMLHELAHLASATETACLASSWDAALGERWCNEVAGAAVLPIDALRSAVAEFGQAAPDFGMVRTVAERFRVSLRATATALIRAGLAEPRLYGEVDSEAPTSDYDKEGFGRGGQRAPRRRLLEVGPRAAGMVLGALENRRLSELEARRYLRLDGAELAALRSEAGGAS